MQNIDKLARTLAGLVKQEKTKPYDTTATVVKVEGGIAWIHIPGGVDRTPVEKTIDCKTGDRVTVRVSGGKAWITGNATAPPTDDATANKAGETAKAAQKTAREALKIKQHFWTDDDGAHVTEVEENVFRKNPKGGNTLINSRGLKIREGLNDIAGFEKDDITMRNSAGIPVFTVRSSGGGSMEVSQGEGELLYEPELPIRVIGMWSADSKKRTWAVKLTAEGSTSVVVDGHTGIITYQNNTVTVTGEGFFILSIVYTTAATLPYFTLGSRFGEPGAFSGVIGEGLIATGPGLACGRYNEDKKTLFAVGNGSSHDNRRNIIDVTNNDTTVYNTLKIEGPLEIDGESIYHDSGGVAHGNITTTTGNFVDGAWYRFGPVVTVKFRVRNTAAVAAGGNIFEGVWDDNIVPPFYIATGSYYGDRAIGASLDSNGKLIVRNADSRQLGGMGTNTITVNFTYVLQ